MTPIEEARALFPAWVRWAPLVLHVPLAFLVSFVVSWLTARAALVPARRLRDGPWTERARHAYPARFAFGVMLLANAIVWGAWGRWSWGPLFRLPAGALAALTLAAAWIGTGLAYWRVERMVRGVHDSFARRLRCLVAAYVFLAPVLPLLALLCVTLPTRFDGTAFVLIAAAFAALALHLRGAVFWLGQKLRLCAPAGARVSAAVARAAHAAGQAPPPVYEIPLSSVFAAAFVTSRRLVYSDVAAAVLDDDELAAIAAHELAHLDESPGVIRIRAAAAFVCLPIGCIQPIVATYGWGAYYWVAVACLLPLLLLSRSRLLQRMELRADSEALRHAADPRPYAQALARSHEFNLGPAQMFGRGGTHPHLYDRLLAAGMTPEYPRPRAPSRLRMYASLLVLAVILSVAFALLTPPVMPWLPDELGAKMRVVWTGGRPRSLRELGYLRYEDGDVEGAIGLYRAAARLDPSPYAAVDLALTLASAGRCAEAAAAVADARAIATRSGQRQDARVEAAQAAVTSCARSQ